MGMSDRGGQVLDLQATTNHDVATDDRRRSSRAHVNPFHSASEARTNPPGPIEPRASGLGSETAPPRTAILEAAAVASGGMVSTTGSGGGHTLDVEDRLDELARRAHDIEPHERPSLDGLIDEFGMLPFEKAVTSHDSNPHRYSWFGLEVEKGARSVTFMLSYDEAADYWMYLVDPSGNDVHPTSGSVAGWDAAATHELATVEHPAAGLWLVIGVRLDRGTTVPSKAIAAIDHREITVFGEALRRGAGCRVEIRAGACFVEPLTGLSVTARIGRTGAPRRELRLHDDGHEGVYRADVDLPAGAYSGYIEIRAFERPPVADVHHHRLDLDPHGEIEAPRAETAGFVRHVPISVVVESAKDPSGRAPRDERPPHRPGDGPQHGFDPRRWIGPPRAAARIGTPVEVPSDLIGTRVRR
jgi:hypothetical protein